MKNPECTKTLEGRGFSPEPLAYSITQDPFAGG